MTTNGWRDRAVASWLAVAILVVVAIITSTSLSSSSTTPTDGGTGSGGGHKPTAVPPAVVQLLTVTTVTERCATRGSRHLVKFRVAALKGTPPRKWSTALSTPMRPRLSAVQQAVCHDPLYGVTVANMFANLHVDGVSVASLNHWLRPYRNAAKINDRAAGFIPLLDVAHPSGRQIRHAVVRDHDYQRLANRLNTLLSRFQVRGTHALRSVKNWHLVAGGLKVDGLPEVGLSKRQDRRKALILVVTAKNRCAPLKRIGFNLGDKRPEVFPTLSCKKHEAKAKSTSSHQRSKTHTRRTTTVATHTHRHSTTTHSYGCEHYGTCTETHHKTHRHDCDCVTPAQATQPVPTPATQSTTVPSQAPKPKPTMPVDTASPSAPPTGGAGGGSTTNPIVTGSPTPGDTETHGSPVPTPTGGAMG